MMRAMLYDSGLPLSLWCFALEAMVDVYNILIHSSTQEQPEFSFYHIRRGINDIRVWGCSIEILDHQLKQL